MLSSWSPPRDRQSFSLTRNRGRSLSSRVSKTSYKLSAHTIGNVKGRASEFFSSTTSENDPASSNRPLSHCKSTPLTTVFWRSDSGFSVSARTEDARKPLDPSLYGSPWGRSWGGGKRVCRIRRSCIKTTSSVNIIASQDIICQSKHSGSDQILCPT